MNYLVFRFELNKIDNLNGHTLNKWWLSLKLYFFNAIFVGKLFVDCPIVGIVCELPHSSSGEESIIPSIIYCNYNSTYTNEEIIIKYY